MRRWTLPIIVLIALAVAGSGWVAWKRYGPALAGTQGERFGDPYVVRAIDVPITVTGTGQLEAINKLDVACPVEGENTIVSIVEEGKIVAKDDVVVTLDTSELERRLQTTTVEVRKGESDVTWAKKEMQIQASKNDSEKESAEVELKLADLSLKEYVEGVYPQKLKAAKMDVDAAKLDLSRSEQELSQQRVLLQRGFATAADIDKAQQEVLEKRNKLDKAITEADVLERFTHEKEVAEKTDKLKQAKNKLDRVASESASQLAQKDADLQAKSQSLELSKQLLDRLQKQIAACTIKAPGNGIVIYSTSIIRYSDERRLQAGSKVYEGRTILQIPDTSRMKVKLLVPEDRVIKLQDFRKGEFTTSIKLTTQDKTIGGKITSVATLPDEGGWWWDNASKKYAVDIELEETPPTLKPGMSGEVTITLRTLPHVIAVPPAAIYATGTDAWAFVQTGPGKVEPRPIKIGESSAMYVVINDGLKEGESVVLLQPGQGRRLLDQANGKKT
ncbi:MAG: efflux RND transporter periplasmic adaptor subunit [Tepidisphaeraceae bacterium]